MKSNRKTIIMSNSIETLEIFSGVVEVNIARVQFWINAQEPFSATNRPWWGLRVGSNRAASCQRVTDEVEKYLRNANSTFLKENVSAYCHMKYGPGTTEESRTVTLNVNKGGGDGPGDGSVENGRCSFPVPASWVISRNGMHFSPTWTVRQELKKVRERNLYRWAAYYRIPSDPAVWFEYKGFGESFIDAPIAQIPIPEILLPRCMLHAELVCAQEFEQNRIFEVARLKAIKVKAAADKQKEVADQMGARQLERMETVGANVDIKGYDGIRKKGPYFKFERVIKYAMVKKSKSRSHVLCPNGKQYRKLIENTRIVESNVQMKMDLASAPQTI